MRKILSLLLGLAMVCCSVAFAETTTTVTGTATTAGYGGDVTATVTLEGDKIVSVEITGAGETPGIGQKIIEEYPALFTDANGIVDAYSGATFAQFTRAAVLKAVMEALQNAGFTVKVENDYSEEVPEGVVMAQTPEGNTKAQKGSEVVITVSLGPDLEGKVEMISLVDLSETQAKLLLEQLGLRMGRVTPVVTYDQNQVGIILSQTVQEGVYIDRGTAIDVEVGSQMTYSYTASIAKPSANDGSQGADYTNGTIVHIVVKTVSGQVLLETDTASFPFEGTRYTGISDSAGIVTLSWNYTYQEEVPVEVDPTPTEEITDSSGGEPAVEPTPATQTIERTEPRSVTRTITFTPEY